MTMLLGPRPAPRGQDLQEAAGGLASVGTSTFGGRRAKKLGERSPPGKGPSSMKLGTE